VNAFLAVALTHVMRATVPIPALTSASVLHSAAVGGSVLGVVRVLQIFWELSSCELGEFNSCELGVFRF